MSSND